MSWKRHHVQHVKGFWKRPEDLEMGFGKDPCKVVWKRPTQKRVMEKTFGFWKRSKWGKGTFPTCT